MKRSEAFPSEWLGSTPEGRLKMQGEPKTAVLEIAAPAFMHEFKNNGVSENKACVQFTNGLKIALPATSWDTLAELAGDDDSANWVGLSVEAYCTKVQFGPKMVWAVRFREAPKGASANTDTAPPFSGDEPDTIPRAWIEAATARLNSKGCTVEDLVHRMNKIGADVGPLMSKWPVSCKDKMAEAMRLVEPGEGSEIDESEIPF